MYIQLILYRFFSDNLVSYSMRQGDARGTESNFYDFYDFTYDGVRDGDYLMNGLGQLTDGTKGTVIVHTVLLDLTWVAI